MGLFDFFKKKKTDSTFPENELEQSLLDASMDLSNQKEFYQKLLWNELFVLTNKVVDLESFEPETENDITVQFVAFENGDIPIFTSINRIYDKRVIKEDVSFLAIKGMDLLGFEKGVTFVLNPYSNYGKVLVPEEIENLLEGTIYQLLDEQEIEHKKIQEFNETFERGCKKQEGLIYLDIHSKKNLERYERVLLEDSIKDFQKCLELIPDHWQSMVLLAKAFQRIDKHEEALEKLENAFTIELENASIAMEAAVEAMYLKDTEKALFYSEESLKRKPNDFALLGNHALNLIVAHKDQEAKETIEKAILLHPNDQVNKNIQTIIKNVIAGKRQRPLFEELFK